MEKDKNLNPMPNHDQDFFEEVKLNDCDIPISCPSGWDVDGDAWPDKWC
jgi:hypothetical protein